MMYPLDATLCGFVPLCSPPLQVACRRPSGAGIAIAVPLAAAAAAHTHTHPIACIPAREKV
jgi:hypothetical protein